MNRKVVNTPNGKVTIVNTESPILTCGQSALEFAVNAGSQMIIVNKAAVCEDFFKLSTGIAGEIVQKFVTYGYRLVIVGDFLHYKSKPLQDYIYECNKGEHIYFANDESEALKKLGGNADK